MRMVARFTIRYIDSDGERYQVEKDDYQLLIQKQPGTDHHQYSVEAGGKKQEFELKTDKELRFKI